MYAFKNRNPSVCCFLYICYDVYHKVWFYDVYHRVWFYDVYHRVWFYDVYHRVWFYVLDCCDGTDEWEGSIECVNNCK